MTIAPYYPGDPLPDIVAACAPGPVHYYGDELAPFPDRTYQLRRAERRGLIKCEYRKDGAWFSAVSDDGSAKA